MVTFTLPEQLRSLAWQHQRLIYDLLFQTAAGSLKQFGTNSKKLDADLGMTGVLHTHSRRLDYHPHIHFVVPGGGINTLRKEWRKLKGNYLFSNCPETTPTFLVDEALYIGKTGKNVESISGQLLTVLS